MSIKLADWKKDREQNGLKLTAVDLGLRFLKAVTAQISLTKRTVGDEDFAVCLALKNQYVYRLPAK